MESLLQIRTDLKETNKQLSRIADALEILNFHTFGHRSENLVEQASSFDPKGTEVEYFDHDQQAVAEAVRRTRAAAKGVPFDEEDTL